MLRHELVELFLVLGVTQTIQEALELVLFFLETPQRLDAVLVESTVAGGRRAEAEAAAEAAALHAVAHPLHLVLHALHLVFEAAVTIKTTHFPAPEREEEKCEAHRPPEHKAENDQHDVPWRTHAVGHPLISRVTPAVEICSVGHLPLHQRHRAACEC